MDVSKDVSKLKREPFILKDRYLNIFLSIYINSTIVIVFIILSDEFIHWFTIPVLMSGIIIGMDAIDWIRKKVDLFDPVGFIGLFGFHFFFLAPLLQIYWDFGMTYVDPPDDWRNWLGGMAIINSLGLIIYRKTRKFIFNKLATKKIKSYWKINTLKMLRISIPLLIIMFSTQVLIYARYGGIFGYITTFTEKTDDFEGQGFLFLISESFPIILLFLIALLLRKSKHKKNILLIFSFLLIYFIIRIFFGGLRGSRSNILWAMIWAVGVIHLWLRPLSRKFIYFGIIILIVFALGYDVYKKAGSDVLKAIQHKGSLLEVSEKSGRGIDTVLLDDLSRTNVQAYVLYKLVAYPDSYQLALGRSYLGDISILIPKKIWPDRIPTKVKEGTDIIKGQGSYDKYDYISSRIYGLTGEFMLNFGYLFTPLTFIILGVYVALIRYLLYFLRPDDGRLLLYPFLVISCFLILVQDLDNFIFGLTKNFSLPFIIVFLSSVRETRE